MSKKRSAIQIAVALLVAVVAATANADWFLVPDGSWFVGTNWSGGLVPTTNVQAFVHNGRTCRITQPGAICKRFGVGSNSNQTGTIILEAPGTLETAVWYARIGQYGTGILNQVSGEINGGGKDFIIAEEPGGAGMYTMDDGTLTNVSLLVVGQKSVGTFEVNDGRVEVPHDNTIIGRYAGAHGTVTHNGGTWDMGGNHLHVGRDPGATGEWNIGGTAMVSNFNVITVGYEGNGTATLQGNASVGGMANTTYIGRGLGATGTVVQSGGTWDNGEYGLTLGGPPGSFGSWTLSGGVVTNVKTFNVSANGSGEFTMSGGTFYVGTGANYVGRYSNSVGRATFSGGLWEGNGRHFYVGQDLTATGSVTISSGTITNVGQIHCGRNGTGTLRVEGSDAAISSVQFNVGSADDTFVVAPDAGGITTINASGNITLTGTLAVDFEDFDYHTNALVLIEYGSVRTGEFDAVNVLTPGWRADVEYDDVNKQVKLVNIWDPPKAMVFIVH